MGSCLGIPFSTFFLQGGHLGLVWLFLFSVTVCICIASCPCQLYSHRLDDRVLCTAPPAVSGARLAGEQWLQGDGLFPVLTSASLRLFCSYQSVLPRPFAVVTQPPMLLSSVSHQPVLCICESAPMLLVSSFGSLDSIYN